MENFSPKYQAWAQVAKENSPPLNLYTLAIVIATLCITTRILSGGRSRVRVYDSDQTRDVRKLPYWVPYIGHAISLGLGSVNFLLRARFVPIPFLITFNFVLTHPSRKSLDNDPVFSLHMGGKTHNMITTPSLMHSLFVQRTAASHDSFISYIMIAVFGFSKDIRNMDPKHTKAIHGTLNLMMREPCLSNMASATVRAIERESPNLVSFSPSLIDQSSWERVSEVSVLEDDPNVCEANLSTLIRNFVGYNATKTLMGRSFMDLYPNILEDLWTFDCQFNLLLLGTPAWFPLPRVSAAYAARSRLNRAVSSFHAAVAATDAGKDPGFDWQDMDDVSEVMLARAREWNKTGLHPRVTGPGDLAVLWAMNVNANMAVYWLLIHIISDPELLAEISEEIAPFAKAARPDPATTGFPMPEPPTLSLDIDGLLNSCPMFKAACYETLRLDSAAFSYKEVMTDFTLTESQEDAALRHEKPQSYNFRTGEYVCIPNGVHHQDQVYFPDPNKFDPRRFLVKDDEKLAQDVPENDPEGKKSNRTTRGLTADMGAIRPFGGGSTVCKGRLFAEREILAFVAGLLVMWDIQPADGKPWKVPGRVPASAVALPDKEVRVKLKLKV